MNARLPPEFDSVLTELESAPENVRAMWRYAIVLAMIDDEKVRVMGTRTEGGHVLLSVRTVAGDDFEIERPAMSEETERMLLEQIREIISDDQEGKGPHTGRQSD